MKSYRFLTSAQRTPVFDAKTLNDAKTLTGLNEILEASKCIGTYEFAKDDELTDFMRKATAMQVVRHISEKSGIKSYRVEVSVNGSKYLGRLYGNGKGNEYPETIYKPEEIKKAVWGYCTSDGERVTEQKTRGLSVVNVPVFYLKVGE